MTRESSTSLSYSVEREVITRYANAAEEVEPLLCCPTEGYDETYLKIIPEEILQKDYGCGDPSRFAREGETVVDLGSGGGKICYILAQKVGSRGRVIGVDFNDTMLALARKYRTEIGDTLGYHNVDFVKARIQDMRLNLDLVDAWLGEHPIGTASDLSLFESTCDSWRETSPAVPDGVADLVVSNCVLNLVRPEQKRQTFAEMFRVLRRGGRAVISDIVCDEEPTEKIKNDPALWSGCIAGAFVEQDFLKAFEDAGFYGIEILSRGTEPWQVIDGIEFRSVTVRAYKGKQGPCLERNQAVIYKGPWSKVYDDDGHVFHRGQPMAICDKTFHILTGEGGPYGEDMIPVEPRVDIPLDEAKKFDCRHSAVRHPRVTKGEDYDETILSDGDVCGPDGCC